MSELVTKVTSGNIRTALTLRYPRGSHVLLWEVANGTGANGRRFADAIAFGMYPSHGHELEGIEIKVSRSDFLNEMKNPEKSQAVYKYCNRWWLAVPKGLVEESEVPSTWGILELVNDVIRVKKKAPALEPIPPSLTFLAALMRRAAGNDEEMSAQLINREVSRREAEIANRETVRANGIIARRVGDAEKAMEKIKAIKDATGIDLIGYTPTEDYIAALNYLCGKSYNKDKFESHFVEMVRDQATRLVEAIDQLPRFKRDGDSVEVQVRTTSSSV